MNSMENSLLSILKKEHIISVISHINPDGDSIGSLLALGTALKRLYNTVYIFINDELPKKYTFLPGVQDIIVYKHEEEINFDFCFVLDCGDSKRLGYSEIILNKSNVVVNIDHHISNTNFGDINIIDINASSTSEIVFNLLKNNNIPIDKKIATCLYTGITTDTGNFTYDNTTSYTHRVAAELMEQAIDLTNITFHLYQNKPLNSVEFLGDMLRRLKTSFDGKLAIITITEDDLEKYNLSSSDVDGVINYARDIQGVEIAILLKETSDGFVKIGLRSKNTIDVSKLAGKFGGGGHKKAAGATVKGSLVEVQEKIEVQIKKSLGWWCIALKGILNIIKPPGMTSHDVVAIVRKKLRIKRVGHTGTLDPNAAGVLPICIGQATKISQYLLESEKKYRAEMKLGITTDTQDIYGSVINYKNVDATEEEIRNALLSFIGEYNQVPPMYSALKMQGKKLYELARQGIEVVREPRRVYIKEINIINIKDDTVLFDVICSKGTYIRTLCHDVGELLGCGAVMSFLLRTATSRFEISSAITLEELQAITDTDELKGFLKPIDYPLVHMPRINIDEKYKKAALNGNTIPIQIPPSENLLGSKIRIYVNEDFIGIASIIENSDRNKYIKFSKIFA